MYKKLLLLSCLSFGINEISYCSDNEIIECKENDDHLSVIRQSTVVNHLTAMKPTNVSKPVISNVDSEILYDISHFHNKSSTSQESSIDNLLQRGSGYAGIDTQNAFNNKEDMFHGVYHKYTSTISLFSKDIDQVHKTKKLEQKEFFYHAAIFIGLIKDLLYYEIDSKQLKPAAQHMYWQEHKQMEEKFDLKSDPTLLHLISGIDKHGKVVLKLDDLKNIVDQLKKPSGNTNNMHAVPNEDAHFYVKGVELEKVINDIFKKNYLSQLSNINNLSKNILDFMYNSKEIYRRALVDKDRFDYKLIKHNKKFKKYVNSVNSEQLGNGNNTVVIVSKVIDENKGNEFLTKGHKLAAKYSEAVDKADIISGIVKFIDEIIDSIKKKGHIS